jgi:LysM repeat protein
MVVRSLLAALVRCHLATPRPAWRTIITPAQYNDSVRLLLCVCLLVVAGCTSAAESPTPSVPDLRPYATVTRPAKTPLPAGIVVTPETPVATATAFEYSIQAGDTLSQIAEKFHISLDQLVAQNPDLSPNAMPIGKVLKIPSSPAIVAGRATPTAAPLPVTQVGCHRIANGGLWCFALVHNDSQWVVENVTAQFSMVGPDGVPIDSKAIALPLDILPPDQSLPLSVYFPPGIALEATPRVQIQTAMPLLTLEPRYLAATIPDALADVSWSGLTAKLTGEVALPEGSANASTVWVVGVAYDQMGNVIGVRRWEGGPGLSAGSRVPFSFLISAVAGRIDRVDFLVEARP